MSEQTPMQSAELNELAAALAKAQGAMHGAKKDNINPHFKSKYADLASVWDACRAPLAENGLSVVQATGQGEAGIPVIITTLLHSSGQWMRGIMEVHALKPGPQALGSALTYARRYSLSAMVGIAPEDDDAEAGENREPEASPATMSTLRKAMQGAKTTAELREVGARVREAQVSGAQRDALKKLFREISEELTAAEVHEEERKRELEAGNE